MADRTGVTGVEGAARLDVPDALFNDVDLRGTIAIQIYRELLLDPKQTVREVARKLDCTERTVTRNLARLEAKGWLERERADRERPRNSYSFPRLGLDLAS
jgi:DNA-binding HxlR family transcriptional regulator